MTGLLAEQMAELVETMDDSELATVNAEKILGCSVRGQFTGEQFALRQALRNQVTIMKSLKLLMTAARLE
jgi:hypothetical protein